MNELDDQLARHLRRTADTVTVSWDRAAPRVARRARERARRRTAARVGAAVAASAATVAGLAAVTSSPSGLAPAAGPGTTVAPGTPSAPRYVLDKRAPNHAESNVSPADPSVTLTFTAYRRPDATGPADPYLLVVTADATGYSVTNGLLQEHGEHRSIGWVSGDQVTDVRSFGVAAEELARLAPLLRDRRDDLPTELESWERSEVRPMSAASRYDSITYDNVEIHNTTGTDVARLIDDRLSQAHTTVRVTVAGNEAVLIDVSTADATRYWVAWHGPDGLTELDIEGVSRDQLDTVLANVVSLDRESYQEWYFRPATATSGP